jgi:glycosyltransferase involved in cell wall biosynthesis
VRVRQFVPVLLPHDAVGNIVRAIDQRLRASGVDAGILVVSATPPPGAESLARARLRDDDLVLYHLAGNAPEGLRLVAAHPNVVVHYHNITPPELFLPWLPEVAVGLAMARREAALIVRRARILTAVSAYNAEDLGARDVVVTGTLSQHDTLASLAPTPLLPRLREDWERRGRPHDWLFVGRLTPHKRPEDVIAALAAWRAGSGEDARLTLVGRPASPAYLRFLRRRISELGLAHRVHRRLRPVPPAQLADHYRAAAVYVSASRHEGFGLPLLEAMSMGVPIAALARAAVPETVGDAGILVERADPVELAAAAGIAATRRTQLAPRMAERLRAYDNDRAWAALSAVLAEAGVVELA